MSSYEEISERVERRREVVYGMHFLRGISASKVAKTLEVPKCVIDDDVEALRASLIASFRGTPPDESIAQDLSFIDSIAKLAAMEAESCDDQLARNEFLRTAAYAAFLRGELRLRVFGADKCTKAKSE